MQGRRQGIDRFRAREACDRAFTGCVQPRMAALPPRAVGYSLSDWSTEPVPPKGGTLTAAGAASPVTQNHAELLESRCAVRRKAQKTSVSFFFFFFFRL